MISISGYRITERVHDGVQTTVFRGVRTSDGVAVILKTIKAESPTLQQLSRWSHEFEITRRLDGEGVARAHDLVFAQGRPVLVLEDIGGRSLADSLVGEALETGAFLELAIALAAAIARLHARRIIHKDINPSNVILHRESGRLQVIDFGISSLLSREEARSTHGNVLEGTLAYVSPEQTGRMNRALDYRTDFYSLGVTLYELLTGELPFRATDRMELIHCHIARLPRAPDEVDPRIPAMLSRIVMKLLAKTAEERYQSAAGLADDLRRCRDEWKATGAVAPFEPGARDISPRLQIPQKIYGRAEELAVLLGAFQRIASSPGGGRELMLVAGYSGIGKSALVNELHKPIVERRGFFVAGKFDQYQKNVPYHAILQAFTELLRQILTGSAEEVSEWNATLAAALGQNGRVIADVLPDVELILGPQPPVPELSAMESQNRFHLAFLNFARAFARVEHPLALFLDDLQWADLPTLTLLDHLLSDPDMQSLLVIGAYRDNQVGPTHPMTLAVGELKKKLAVSECTLRPLSLEHLTALVGDSLLCGPARAVGLARLLLEKTNGNPFFVNQLLIALYDQGRIRLDPAERAWQWDLEALGQIAITENVADLMASKINTLLPATRGVLELAACIGNRFDLETLSIVHERSPIETGDALFPALEEGLVVASGHGYKVLEGLRLRDRIDARGDGLALDEVSYKFHHDQIQQAAYSLIDAHRKKEVHLRIGRLLLAKIPASEREERIFDIVNQLDVGSELVKEPREREELLGLNLAAGKRARSSAAYSSALGYLQVAVGLLEPDCWSSQYELALEVHLEAAEAAYLSTDFDTVGRHIQLVLANARTLHDKVRIHEVELVSLVAQRRLPDAIKTGLAVLRLLGVEFPETPTMADIGAEIGRTVAALAGRSPEELLQLPPMSDPDKLAAMRILERSTSSAYQAAPVYLPLFICRQVQLSALHGAAPNSAYAYATYGLILCGALGDIQGGYDFGTLGLRLEERNPDRRQKCRVFHVAHTFTRPWKEHVRATLDPLLEAWHSGVETGDFEYASYASLLHGYYSYFAGVELPLVEKHLLAFGHSVGQMKQALTRRYYHIWRQVMLNLLGRSDDPTVIAGEAFDERTTLPAMVRDGDDRTGLFFIYYNRMVLEYLFGRYEAAAQSALLTEQTLDAITAMMANALFAFHDSLIRLARLARYEAAADDERAKILERVAANQEKLGHWARHAPMNFEHQRLLVEAERARVGGREMEAMRLYQQAIERAREDGYIQNEALAAELAARLYRDAGLARVADSYLADARVAYARWGAVAKVRELEARFPQIVARPAPPSPTGSRTIPTTTEQLAIDALDFASVLKASQAISRELVLEELLKGLTRIAVENAAAERGILLFEREGHLEIAAESVVGRAEAVAVAAQGPIESARDPDGRPLVPAALVNLAARTREPVILGDASAGDSFAKDPYFRDRSPKSALALPLIHQGHLLGVLYLENSLTPNAFTPQRLEVLKLLSAQISISITNARLFRNLEQASREVHRKEEQTRQFLEAMPVGVFVVNARGEPYYANDSARRLLGRGIEPWASTGQLAEVYRAYREGSDELYPAESMPIVKALSGQHATVEDMEIKRGFARIPLQVSATPIVDDAGQVIYAIGVFQDITEHKRARKVLEDYSRTLELAVQERTRAAASAQQAAEAANTAKSTFLTNMSHEIRTPLTALLGFSDLLLEPRLNDSDRLNYSLIIRRNGEHLLSLINDILDLSKIEAGKMVLERIDCSLSQVLADVSSLMRARAEHKGLEFDIQLLTSIPSAIKSDPMRLRQILLNLVGNAIKFTREGSVRVLARYEPRTTRPSLWIDVIDTGIGMSPEQLAGLFQAFNQADPSMSRRFGGTGLGLAICRPLAEALGGEILVRSEPQHGSAFTLRLSVEVGEGATLTRSIEAPAVTPHADRGAPARLSGRLLLAEDGVDNQVLIGTILRRRGLEVTVAPDGQSAIEQALTAWQAGAAFDVILMDMQMPVLDGYGATERLRQCGYELPIVALTAHAMAGDRDRCLAAGCDDYISKPIDHPALVELVSRHLKKPSAEAAASATVADDGAGEAPLTSRYSADPEMRELVEKFLARLPTQMTALREAAAKGNRPELRKLVHQLKGSAGGYGYMPISEVSERLERELDKDGPLSSRLLDELLRTCARAR